MNGISRTVLNSSPVQKMYEEGLTRNSGRVNQSGAGFLNSAANGLVGKIVKKVMPKAGRKRRRNVSRAVQGAVGRVARVLQRGRGRKRGRSGRRVGRVQNGGGRRKPVGSRIGMKRKRVAGRKRKVINSRGKPVSRSRKQSGSGRRRLNRSHTIKI